MVAITENWPAMTRKVWPRSRRLSSASTWSGVRLRSSGGSSGLGMRVSLVARGDLGPADHSRSRFNHIRGGPCHRECPQGRPRIQFMGELLFDREDQQPGVLGALARGGDQQLLPLGDVEAGARAGGG